MAPWVELLLYAVVQTFSSCRMVEKDLGVMIGIPRNSFDSLSQMSDEQRTLHQALGLQRYSFQSV